MTDGALARELDHRPADAGLRPLAGDGPLAITFDAIGPDAWGARLARMPRSNLLQSFAYGRAIRLTRQMMPRFGVITLEGEEVGLVQIQEVRLLGLHTFVLDRGPLWITGLASLQVWHKFFEALNAWAPPRIGRWRRIMPELPDGPEHRRLLEECGFRLAKADGEGHRSIWLDLTRPEGDRRVALGKGWRNALTQAEKTRMEVEIDETGRTLDWLLARYAADKKERGYPGPAPRVLRTLAESCFAERQGAIYRAREKGEPLAGILVLGHGAGATYQIGWTSGAGRMLNAHHLLLWRAAAHLAAKGYRDFDLGGINPDTADGVTRFKRGLGGEEYTLVPIYR